MFGPVSPRSRPQPGHLYDVAVVGAGLAGTELAWRLARAGRDVLLVSQALDHLGNLYQPTTQGVTFPGGSLFEEVRAALHPDTDGWTFHRHLKARVEQTAGIHLLQSTVTALDEETAPDQETVPDQERAPEEAQVVLSTWEGPKLRARLCVLAVGAFLKGRLLVGDTMDEAGRLSEVAYDFLADDLTSSGIWLVGRERRAEGEGVEPPYEVRFLTPAPTELDGFRVNRLERVRMLGQCTPGDHTYASVLQDAARLADELTADLNAPLDGGVNA
ncbi:FAD-dependent oxidoreductase [Deinococcus sp.]|uniref:FAD-dependent oxidoreductase n=1 Tax=Deinococcus sp. TaxID=47478 RepID=UPI0025BDBBEF|nr:FAD-dependent oxidoreductase [Deinococcus sp.]